MDKDDRPIGRVLSRRETLALLGTSAAALLVGCGPAQPEPGAPTSAATSAAGGATATPLSFEAATATVLQSNPTAAATGAAELTAVASATATVAAGAVPACVVRPEQTEGPYFVDDKLDRSDIRSDPTDGSMKEGIPLLLTFKVSQVSNSGCTPLGGATVDIWHCDALGVYSDVSDPGFNTVGQQWLRGYQTTEANGQANFTTIYPGWYQGRTVHIHFKIRTTTPSG
jgi:protocatechuate 3,4-dioxygenase beta subunit